VVTESWLSRNILSRSASITSHHVKPVRVQGNNDGSKDTVRANCLDCFSLFRTVGYLMIVCSNFGRLDTIYAQRRSKSIVSALFDPVYFKTLLSIRVLKKTLFFLELNTREHNVLWTSEQQELASCGVTVRRLCPEFGQHVWFPSLRALTLVKVGKERRHR
jgi:hypothetical protein